MRTAVMEGDAIGAPSVGTWTPSVGPGAPLSPGMRLGWLSRAGARLEVTAPRAVTGVAVVVTPPGTWVAFGDPLVVAGEGGQAIRTAPAARQDADAPEGTVVLRADTDGTVYLRADPRSPAFAVLGSRVEAHATLALVEVMKTFTPVRAPVAGEVVRVLVDDAVAVRAGAPLFHLRP